MSSPMVLILFGVLVGVFSGFLGLGGGAVMIPAMVIGLGLSQQQAQGTSLAVMLPPVALPALIEYWRNGNVRWEVAGWMIVGMVLGALPGAYLANHLPKDTVRLAFGFTLLYVAAYTVFGKEHLHRTVILAGIVTLIGVLIFALTRWYDAR